MQNDRFIIKFMTENELKERHAYLDPDGDWWPTKMDYEKFLNSPLGEIEGYQFLMAEFVGECINLNEFIEVAEDARICDNPFSADPYKWCAKQILTPKKHPEYFL